MISYLQGIQLNEVFDRLAFLTEGRRRDFMTDEEKKVQRRLIRLLRDDGKGHHHAAYAKRLAKYDVNIVPLGKEPSTAAISFDEGIIYINRGFLRDPSTFGQLNVIMRHELLHNLLMHQFRMIKKLSTDVPELNLSTSNSIHTLLNALEDFEISNKKYSAEDKETVRNTWLNGVLISGLVTEDHRPEWTAMSVERMYDAISQEIAKYQHTGKVDPSPGGTEGNLNIYAAELHKYKNLSADAEFETLDEFKEAILAPALVYDKNAKLPQNYEDIFKAVQGIVDNHNNKYDASDINKMLKEIADSKAIAKQDIVSPITGEVLCTVYTPEEKLIAVECLKIISGKNSEAEDAKKWYDEVLRKINSGEYTEQEIEDLYNSL